MCQALVCHQSIRQEARAMRCEIYGSPTSTHYTQIVGHIADDGNVYNSRSGEAGA